MTAGVLKAMADGHLRAFKPFGLEFTHPRSWRFPLSTDCNCCEQFSTNDTIAAYTVDLEEPTTITAAGYASTGGGYFTDIPLVSPEIRFSTTNTSAFIKLYNSNTHSGDGTEFAVNGGFNTNALLFVDIVAGDDTHHAYFDLGSTFAPILPLAVTYTAHMHVRKFAFIKYRRRNRIASEWGESPRSGHPEDGVDLRPYSHAPIQYWTWGEDGNAEAAVSIVYDGNTYELSAAGGGPPVQVVAGSAGITSAAMPCTLTLDYLGAASIPAFDNTTTIGATEVRSWGEHQTINLEDVGINPPERIGLSLTNVQPDRTIAIDSHEFDVNGVDWPADEFDIEPYAAVVDPYDPAPTVNTEYPDGTAIAFTSPGTWTATGTAYGYRISGMIGASTYVFEDTAVDTIKTPTFGFKRSVGSFGDRANFRYGLIIKSWLASVLTFEPLRTIDSPGTANNWTDNDYTESQVVGGALEVTGGFPRSVSREFTATTGFSHFRYMLVRLNGTAAQTITFTSQDSRAYTVTLTVTGWNDTTIDLMKPDGASGVSVDSTKLEVGTGSGDWAWGLEDVQTLTATSAADFKLQWLKLSNTDNNYIISGEAVYANESIFKAADITLYPGTSFEDTVDVYNHRCLMVSPSGRISLDESGGDITYNNIPPSDEAWSTWNVCSAQDMIKRIQAIRSTAGGCVSATNLLPSNLALISAYDGAWVYVAGSRFFTNGQPAYFLTPTAGETAYNAAVELWMSYALDAISPGVGVQLDLDARKIVGGGLHGVTVTGETGVHVVENTDSDTSLPFFVLPSSEHFVHDVSDTREDYTFAPTSGAFSGDTTLQVINGVSLHRGFVKP